MDELTRTTHAAAIRREHEAVNRAIAEGLAHAREAGRLLTEDQTLIPYGGWGTYVEQDCGLSRSTAAGYMRVYRRWAELEPHVQRVAQLPLRAALALLAEPRPEPEVAAPAFDLPLNHKMIGSYVLDDIEYLAYIHPSTTPEYVFVTVTVLRARRDGDDDDDANTVTGYTSGVYRAIRRDRVPRMLELEYFDVDRAEWSVSPISDPDSIWTKPWTYNELMFSSREESTQSRYKQDQELREADYRLPDRVPPKEWFEREGI